MNCIYDQLDYSNCFVYTVSYVADWDPRKRLSNLAKHGVDFASAEFFEWDVAVVYASLGAAEPRLVAYAPIASRLHALVFSIETRTVRVIGLRRANRREIKRYEAEA